MTVRSFSPTRRQVLLAASLLPLMSACGKKSRPVAAIPRGATVLAFGDSVTYGTGAGQGEDWPTLLAATSGWRIINAGVPGDTTENAKTRIDALLQEHRPAMVIIELGGNDFLRRRDPAAVKADLKAILGSIRSAGAAPVLVAVPELSFMAAVAGRPSDSPIFGQLAQEEKVPLIDSVFSDVLGKPQLKADQIHPNAAGYREMAGRFEQALRRLGVLG